MGWYESRVFESAWPQVDSVVKAILSDPYLMPPCPVFYRVFDRLADNDTYWANSHVKDTIKAVVKSLHNAVMNLGAGDHEIDLLEFWKFLLEQGEKDNYSSFVFPMIGGELDEDMETGYLDQPLCMWARIKYYHAAHKFEENYFFITCRDLSLNHASIQVTEHYLQSLGEIQ